MNLYKLLFQRWPLLLGVAAVFGALGFVYTYTLKPTWEARSVLMYLPNKEQAEAGPLLGVSPTAIVASFVSSHTVIKTIAKEHKMSYLQAQMRLAVSASPDSLQVMVTTQSENKDKALAVLKTAISTADKFQNDFSRNTATRKADSLTTAIARKEADVKVAEAKIVEAASGKTLPVGLTDSSLNEYTKKLFELELEKASVEKQIAMSDEALSAMARTDIKAVTPMPRDSEWREQLAALEIRVAKARATSGPEAPELVRAQAELEAVQRRFRQAVEAYVKSAATTAEPGRLELETKLRIAEQQIPVYRDLVARAPKDAVKMEQLKREYQGAVAILEQLKREYEVQTAKSLTSGLAFSVLEEPYVFVEPVNKRYLFNTALFGVIGIALVSIFIAAGALRQELRSGRQPG